MGRVALTQPAVLLLIVDIWLLSALTSPNRAAGTPGSTGQVAARSRLC